MAINILFKGHIRKALYRILAVGLSLFTLGATLPPAMRLPVPGHQPESFEGLGSVSGGAFKSASEAPGVCLSQPVTITLASEQVSLCAPTSLPFNVVEDNNSDSSVNYAGLTQMDGYGILNIKATAPGNMPGPGRPVYTSDGATSYREAVWDMETIKADRSVLKGPSGVFWNETIPGLQVDVSLSTSAGDLKVRSIEWYVEHNGRLWSFIFAWDTEMQNAGEWEVASGNFSVQKAEGVKLADTAINLGTTSLEPQTAGENSSYGAPVDVGTPSWWDGVCNKNNFHKDMGKDSIPLGGSWHGVLACGPLNSMHLVHFFSGAHGELEFQCVELVMRFLYMEWGIAPWGGNGNTIKNAPPSSMLFYRNDGSHWIVPGDIITEDASSQNSAGHTVVVTGVSLDGTGTGTVSILEENAYPTGSRSLHVTNGTVDPDSYAWGQTIQGWLHVKGNLEDGTPDPGFTPGTGPDGRVNAIALKPNGKILIGGEFGLYNGISRNNVARLNSDGTVDGYNPVPGVAMTGDAPHVYTLAVYTDGRVLIGGHFDSYNGIARNYIARLNSDGSLDTTFTPAPAINADISKIVIRNPDDSASKILVGGAGFLYRLKSNGSLDTAFTGTSNNRVSDIAVQPDGKIIIGGDFSQVDGIDRAGIARLNSNGSLDASFDPGTGTGGNAVKSISLDPDGKVIIGGTFLTYDGTSRNRLARVNSNGSLDTTFNPGTGISGSSEYVQTILAQTDGKILIGGDFSSYNGTELDHIGRLNNDGSIDTSFPASLDGGVQALVLQPDGEMLVGGDFTNHFARLLNHVESCYTLSTQVTPVSGGSLLVDPAPNCPGGKYLSGTLVQVTILLNPDYWLVNWSGDASGSSNPLGLTMYGDKSVTATLMVSPGHFNKSLPINGGADVPANPSLRWGTSAGASSYEYCLDTTNDHTCDSGIWVSTGASTSAFLSNLPASVPYYWQVRARNLADTTDATGGWWSFTSNGIPEAGLYLPLIVSSGE